MSVLSAVAAVAVAYLTFVAWVVIGMHESMDPIQGADRVGGWVVRATGVGATIGLLWATRYLWRSARPPRADST
jgi:hypothetical protein